MDEIVRQSMLKWPEVPDCYGWLGLDARGHWFMRDEATQAAGNFLQSKGTQLQHAGLIAFINRNYCVDSQGRWFFQNGPQRVFVELEITPLIFRLEHDGALRVHTGQMAHAQASFLDEQGRVFLLSEQGLGLLHSQDVFLFSELQEKEQEKEHALVLDAASMPTQASQSMGILKVWQPTEVDSSTLAMQFGFVLSPQQQQQSILR